MSHTVHYKTPKHSDGEVLTALQAIAEHPVAKAAGLTQLQIGFYPQGEQEIALANVEEDEPLSEVLSGDGQVLQLLRLKDVANQQKYVELRRPAVDPNKTGDIFDTVTASSGNPNQNPVSSVDFTKLFLEVQKHLRPVSEVNLGPLLGPDVTSHFAAREEALNRLQDLVHTMLREMDEARKTRDQELNTKETALEEKYETRVNELENSYVSKHKQLEQREQELEKIRAELDDRSSTHVRRDIRKELKDIIGEKDRFKLSKDTTSRRNTILGVYLLLLVLFGVPAAIFLYRELNLTTGFDQWLFARQVVLSLGFVVTAGFFLRWLNHWAQTIANEELKQKQFELDIDRASWLVEMALEWKAEKGEEIPEHLLARLSQNLFGSTKPQDISMTAADALASAILGSAVKANVSLPGAQVELTKKSIDQLKKTQGP